MRSHRDGTLETVKFAKRREAYYENLVKILELGHSKTDLIHQFPAFVGNLTLHRFISLSAFFKETQHIAGHIGEVGVYKGFGSILFGKLCQIYEPDSLTMVHGFDHFLGTDASTDAKLQVHGGNKSDEDTLRELIRLQDLDSTIKIHNMDAITGFPKFFEDHPHLRFKLIFIDSGTYEVTAASIKALWPRLNKGGIMVFDQYVNEVAPGETRAISELLPEEIIQTIVGSWMPNAFVVKN